MRRLRSASTTDASFCYFRKQPFDQIEPTSARRCEVDLIARMPG